MEKTSIIPLWILCFPRTGSSYLSSLLNNLELFPTFNEMYPNESLILDENLGPTNKNQSFGEWIRVFGNKHVAKYTKAIHHQFDNHFKKDEKVIKNIFNDIKFIKLIRKDKIDQASSMFIAKKLNQYHVYNDSMLLEYKNKNFEINKKELLLIYNEVIKQQNFWNFIDDKNCIKIYYEDLISNEEIIIKNILEFINVKIEINKICFSIKKSKETMKKMNHNLKDICKKIIKKSIIL
jgi:LPS sulfotransferase NodH